MSEVPEASRPGARAVTSAPRGRTKFPGWRRAVLSVGLLAAGCGYVGDPLPPALKIPVPISDLAAVERGENIVIQFTVPRMTTEGLVLKRFGKLDLRIGSEGLQPFDLAVWEAGARPIPSPAEVKAGPVRLQVPAAPWAGQEVLVAARVSNHKGRWSDWSNLVTLHVTRPLPAPTAFEASNVRQGVRLRWDISETRPRLRFRVFRRTGGAGPFTRVAETDQRTWVDTGTRYGTLYEYRVQAIETIGDDVAESEPTPLVSITPVDRFAPAPPTGLIAVAGPRGIALTWEPVRDQDLAFYRVYRSSEDGQVRRIADSLAAPGYSDQDVNPAERYTYTVTAVDNSGNESQPSAAVSATVPRGSPAPKENHTQHHGE